MELIEKLGIDWKLVAAQIVNFGIVLFLLYKFAYKPVLAALDKRRRIIEKGMKDSQKSEDLLKEVQAMKDKSLTHIKEKTAEMMDHAAREAAHLKQEVLAEAAIEAKKVMDKTKAEIETQKKAMIKEAKAEITKIVVFATARILEREFSEDDQSRLTEDAAKEISNII